MSFETFSDLFTKAFNARDPQTLTKFCREDGRVCYGNLMEAAMVAIELDWADILSCLCQFILGAESLFHLFVVTVGKRFRPQSANFLAQRLKERNAWSPKRLGWPLLVARHRGYSKSGAFLEGLQISLQNGPRKETPKLWLPDDIWRVILTKCRGLQPLLRRVCHSWRSFATVARPSSEPWETFLAGTGNMYLLHWWRDKEATELDLEKAYLAAAVGGQTVAMSTLRLWGLTPDSLFEPARPIRKKALVWAIEKAVLADRPEGAATAYLHYYELEKFVFGFDGALLFAVRHDRAECFKAMCDATHQCNGISPYHWACMLAPQGSKCRALYDAIGKK